MQSADSEIAIVIPAFNESGSLGSLLPQIQMIAAGLQIIVVDDCSDDETQRTVMESGATLLHLACNLGPWRAAQAGIRYAMRMGCTKVITMDADGQHPPEMIPALIEAACNMRADIIIGSATTRGTKAHQLAWWLLRKSSGLQVVDLTSGFRFYDNRATELMATFDASSFYYQDVGVLGLAVQKHLTIAEVEVLMAPRLQGSSRIFGSWISVISYMLNTMLLALSRRRKTLRSGYCGYSELT